MITKEQIANILVCVLFVLMVLFFIYALTMQNDYNALVIKYNENIDMLNRCVCPIK